MEEPQSNQLAQVFTNMADRFAFYCYQLSKQGVQFINNQAEIKERNRLKKREKALQEYKKKEALLNQKNPESQESKLARINRIKSAIDKKNEVAIGLVQIDENIVFQHFFRQLQPQIIKKYPLAPKEKIDKLITQKWQTIDPVRKQAYIKKITKKIGQNPPHLNGTEEKKEQQQINAENSQKNNPQNQELGENKFGEFLSRRVTSIQNENGDLSVHLDEGETVRGTEAETNENGEESQVKRQQPQEYEIESHQTLNEEEKREAQTEQQEKEQEEAMARNTMIPEN